MKTSLKILLSAIAAASLLACGGGGHGNAAGTAAGTGTSTDTGTSTPAGAATTLAGNAPAPTAAATAVLAGTQTEANTLAAEVKAGLASAQLASNSSSMAFGVETGSLPAGVLQDMSATLCSTGTASVDASGAAPGAGFSAVYAFNACALKAQTSFSYNGGFSVAYTRYVSPMDFAIIVNFKNFSVTSPTVNLSYTGGVSCDYKDTATSAALACYYTDGSRAFSGGVSYSAGAATGTYTANYGNGVVKVSYSKFGSVGGTATITGANGYSAVVTYKSAGSYTVDITANGSKTTYTVAV